MTDRVCYVCEGLAHVSDQCPGCKKYICDAHVVVRTPAKHDPVAHAEEEPNVQDL